MKKDIFDLNNISDLPVEIILELRLISKVDIKILTVFRSKETLSFSKALVGYYRIHREIRTRQYIATACYRCYKKGLLSMPKKGRYLITKRGFEAINLIMKAEK